MNDKTTSEIFTELITKYTPAIGGQYTKMMQEDYDAGEAQLAFENLVDSLAEMDVKIDEEDRQKLRQLAEAFDRLGYPSGKGIYS
jgi:hypothetical protein